MKRLLVAALSLGLALPTVSSARDSTDPAIIAFGIVPQQSASRLAQMWVPFLSELGRRTGIEFQFRTAKDIPTFEACLAQGAYDIAYMNPMHYAIFSEEAGYRAFARQTAKRLKGIIVARRDSDFDGLSNLDQSRIGFPSPGAFGASILTRAGLAERGINFEPAYVNSHDSVYRAVASGLLPAGGGVTRTFNAVDEGIRQELTIIYETQAYTPHAFAVQSDIGSDLFEQLQSVFLSIAEENPELVSGIGMAGFDAASDEDWDDVRALEMSREDSGITREGQIACPSG